MVVSMFLRVLDAKHVISEGEFIRNSSYAYVTMKTFLYQMHACPLIFQFLESSSLGTEKQRRSKSCRWRDCFPEKLEHM